MTTTSATVEQIDPQEWFSVRGAARHLGVAEVRVRQLLAYGELKGEKIGRSWIIPGHEIQRWHAQRKPVGRPKGTYMYKLDVLGRRRRIKRKKPESKLKAKRLAAQRQRAAA